MMDDTRASIRFIHEACSSCAIRMRLWIKSDLTNELAIIYFQLYAVYWYMQLSFTIQHILFTQQIFIYMYMIHGLSGFKSDIDRC